MFTTLKSILIRHRSQILFLFLGLLVGWIGTSVWDGWAASSYGVMLPERIIGNATLLTKLRTGKPDDLAERIDWVESELDADVVRFATGERTGGTCRSLLPHPLSYRITWSIMRNKVSPDPLMIAKIYRNNYPPIGPLAHEVSKILEPVKIDPAYLQRSNTPIAQMERFRQENGISVGIDGGDYYRVRQ